MPRPVNQIRISGTATVDPKISVLEREGKPLKLANFAIAFDWWHGKKLTPAWFFNCTSFGYTADAVEKFIRKGSKILITDGYVQPNKYQAKDGTWKQTVKIMVEDFIMVGYNKEADSPIDTALEQEVIDIDEVPY